MADVKASSVADLPEDLPAMSIVVVQGDAVFTDAQPLNGVGVLVVFGDLTIPANSNSAYNGLIYVDGDYKQGAPSSISGAVIVTGDVVIQGSSDFSEVNYDPGILSQIPYPIFRKAGSTKKKALLISSSAAPGLLGRWLFHCHLFHHASIGMITELVVLPPCTGDANADANEVWRRLPESNGDLRTSRCTPVSVRNQPKA